MDWASVVLAPMVAAAKTASGYISMYVLISDIYTPALNRILFPHFVPTAGNLSLVSLLSNR